MKAKTGRPYDDSMKALLEAYPREVLGHLLGLPLSAAPVKALPTELRASARTADGLLRARLRGDRLTSLIHLEVQTRYRKNLPIRMLEYAARIYRRYERRVCSFLLVLRPSRRHAPLPQEVAWGDLPQGNGLLFRYTALRVWELDPELGLSCKALLPLYPLMKHTRRTPALLDRCVEQLDTWQVPTDERQLLLECLGSLASLRYNRDQLDPWLRRMRMLKTPLMKWVRDDGRKEGLVEGKAEALLDILSARGLSLSAEQQERIQHCQDVALLRQWIQRAVTASSVKEVLA